MVGLTKLVFLIAFRIICTDDTQSGKVLSGHPVQVIRQLLQLLELRQYEHDANTDDQDEHTDGDAGRQ
ncbi:hypothetical protein D3C71_1384230 [compost metagenome]